MKYKTPLNIGTIMEDTTYEIVIQMRCPHCQVPITFNLQPLIDEYHHKICPNCNGVIDITARLKE